MDYRYVRDNRHGCFVTNVPFMNRGHHYGFASSVGHPRSNSVRLLVNDGIRTIYGAPVLYYRTIGTASTLPGMD